MSTAHRAPDDDLADLLRQLRYGGHHRIMADAFERIEKGELKLHRTHGGAPQQ
jgi:hypothetical protein